MTCISAFSGAQATDLITNQEETHSEMCWLGVQGLSRNGRRLFVVVKSDKTGDLDWSI